jgi:flagellar basal-body rod modification protein FlgD
MSAINSATGSNSTGRPSTSTDAFSSMTSEEFIKIIFAELTNQDPLSPNQTKDLLQQVSTIRSIESDVQLSDKLDDLVRQDQVSSASSLVGKFVAGKTSSGTKVAGFVGSVTITRDGPVLNLSDTVSIPIDNVEQVIDPDLAPTT